jgi:hypothetical protein
MMRGSHLLAGGAQPGPMAAQYSFRFPSLVTGQKNAAHERRGTHITRRLACSLVATFSQDILQTLGGRLQAGVRGHFQAP